VAELSLTAQTILDAYGDFEAADTDAMAAALRAAVDQVVPEEDSYEGGFSDSLEHQCRASERRLARAELLAIAAELEALND
jgi:hypothetical protein